MPDGSQECGAILTRLDAIDDRLNAGDAHFRAIAATLRRIEVKDAAADAAKLAEAKLHQRVGSIVLWAIGGLGSLAIWFTTGGEDWVSKHFK